MHEMGIASSVLEAVHRELHRYPGQRATKVGVRVGQFAGVDAESLRFCFDVLAKDSPLAPLEIEIETSPGDELDMAYLELDEVPADSGFAQEVGA